MTHAGVPEPQWSGYQNLAKVFREMNRCGCGRLKRVTAIRCERCSARRKSAQARSIAESRSPR